MDEQHGIQPSGVFHSGRYSRCFEHLGDVRDSAVSPVPVHVRPIPGTDLVDGLLPYPYSWLDTAQICAVAAANPDLVTLTGVIAPGWNPHGSGDASHIGVVRPYKAHFVFDPEQPVAPLSRRSRRNLARGQRSWRFEQAEASEITVALHRLNREMVRRRGLTGTAFDVPERHFSRLVSLPETEVFTARNGEGFGSIAVGVRGPGGLHFIHLLNSDHGLRSDAAAAVMAGIIDVAVERGQRVYLGGVPTGAVGIERFKRRWTNMTEATKLATLVIDHHANARLINDCWPGEAGYFPEYRRPWHHASGSRAAGAPCAR